MMIASLSIARAVSEILRRDLVYQVKYVKQQ